MSFYVAEIKIITISLPREKQGQIDQTELTPRFILETKLKENGLFGEAFLYSAVDASRFNELAERGTYREDDAIFAYYIRQLGLANQKMSQNLCASLEQLLSPGIAVYRAHHFFVLSREKSHEYHFIDPANKFAALEALVKIEFETI